MTAIRLTLSRTELRTIRAVLDAPTTSFVTLARVAGLDKTRDFRGADLSWVDFGMDDLSDFDFSGADLTGADLSRATGLDHIVTDAATKLPADARRPPSDFSLVEARERILRGEAPPLA